VVGPPEAGRSQKGDLGDRYTREGVLVDFTPARLQLLKEIPKGPGWLYEAKFDDYRGLLMTNRVGQAAVYSRNAKNLSSYFPELVHIAKALPRGRVLDGEIVQPTEGGIGFLHPSVGSLFRSVSGPQLPRRHRSHSWLLTSSKTNRWTSADCV